MNREEVIEVRQRLLDHGYQPVGVFNWDWPSISEKERGKRPNENNWQNTAGMPVYNNCAENTGILTGKIYAPDIDIEDPAVVTEIVAMATKLFGRTSIRYRQNSPRCLLPYRFNGDEVSKLIIPLSCGKIEFLGKGQQFVGFGKHPSGVEYEWKGRSLDKIKIDKLPLISAASVAAFRAWAEARWPIAEKAKPNGAGRNKADFRIPVSRRTSKRP